MNSDHTKTVAHILIVDDDPDDHFMLRRALNKVLPHALVESLYDGSEALAYLEKNTTLPHLIILDLNMAKISGQDTMRLIRKNNTLQQVPVIIYTTSRSESEKQKMLDMGATAFYSKPAKNAELITIVESLKTNWLTFF